MSAYHEWMRLERAMTCRRRQRRLDDEDLDHPWLTRLLDRQEELWERMSEDERAAAEEWGAWEVEQAERRAEERGPVRRRIVPVVDGIIIDDPQPAAEMSPEERAARLEFVRGLIESGQVTVPGTSLEGLLDELSALTSPGAFRAQYQQQPAPIEPMPMPKTYTGTLIERGLYGALSYPLGAMKLETA